LRWADKKARHLASKKERQRPFFCLAKTINFIPILTFINKIQKYYRIRF